MRIAVLMISVLAVVAGCSKSRTGMAQKDEPSTLEPGQRPAALHRDMRNLMHISLAIHMYAAEHNNELPPSLGHTLAYIRPTTAEEASAKEVVSQYISSRDLQQKTVPEKPTAQWIDDHTSYIYLGQAGQKLPEGANWNKVIIVHARLNEGYEILTADKRTVRVIPVAMLDSHAEAEAVAHTEALIAESKTVLAK